MTPIFLTNLFDVKILVNADKIRLAHSRDDYGTQIWFSKNHEDCVSVKESLEEIAEAQC